MISLLSSSLAASSPWLLAAIPCALSLLVYIYRVRGSSRQTVVSSLLFLQHLPRRPVGRKTFVPPFQFWLELAVFVLLILAASGIFVRRTGKHIGIVIDSSLSMGALYGSGGTRLEQAKRAASLDIQRQDPSTTFSIYSSEGALRSMSPARSGSTQALGAVSATTQSYRVDALEEGIARLSSDASLDAIWVYTDKQKGSDPSSVRLVINSLPLDLAKQTNAWIRSIQEISQQEGFSLDIEVGYVGSEAREALLDGECYNSQGSPSPLAPVTLRLSPSARAHGALSTLSEASAYCRVHVRLKDASLFDSLPLDDEGWIARGSTSPSWTVTSPLSIEELGLRQIPTAIFNSSAGPPSLNASSMPLTLIHRQALAALPKGPTLLILPPPGRLPWGGEVLPRAQNSRVVTRWDSAHPTLAYANPSTLEISDVRPLRCPDSSSAILYSSVGPIACAGELDGIRYLIVGFELLPFEGSRSPTLSIFMLNSFKWLSFSPLFSLGPELPLSMKVPEGAVNVAYVAPTRMPLPLSPIRAFAPTSPGVLAFGYPDQSQKMVALNSFIDPESDLSAHSTLSVPIPAPLTKSSAPATSAQQLTLLLSALALSVIAVDLVRRLVRASRWSDA